MKNSMVLVGGIFLMIATGCGRDSLQPPPEETLEAVANGGAPADSAAVTELALEGDAVNYGAKDFKFSPQAPPVPLQKKIVRNASLEIQVTHVDAFLKSVEGDLQKYKVYSVSSQMNRYGSEINHTVELKVPPENLDLVVDLLKQKAVYIRNYSTSSEDVTANYYDAEARLKTKKELEKRYFEILKSARKVSEILEVEEKLSEVRSEIESFEGQLKLYDHQVAYSNLSLTVFELIPTRKQPGLSFGTRLLTGFETGWHKFLQLLISITENWFWWISGIGLVVFWRLRRRK